ncbi:MAG: acyl-CoA thioesterase [Bacteroidota bacterium]
MDKLNHVNNAYYLTYLETARVQYFRQVFGNQVNWSETGFVIARSEINYIKPIYLNDDIYCLTSVIKLGNKSMTVQSAIVKKVGDDLVECAEGIIIMVAMDYTRHTNIRVPGLWRELISEFEGKRFLNT